MPLGRSLMHRFGRTGRSRRSSTACRGALRLLAFAGSRVVLVLLALPVRLVLPGLASAAWLVLAVLRARPAPMVWMALGARAVSWEHAA